MFSPYEPPLKEDFVDVGYSIDAWVKDAVQKEAQRDEEDSDDAEGWPLRYSPFSSPLTSPTSSPTPSPSSSPAVSPLTLLAPLPSHDACLPSSPAQHDFARPSTGTEDAPRRLNHAQVGQRKRRRDKRAARKGDSPSRKTRSSQSEKFRDIAVVKSRFNVRRLPVTSVGFIGKRFDVTAVERSLEEYQAEGFRVLEWSGQ